MNNIKIFSLCENGNPVFKCHLESDVNSTAIEKCADLMDQLNQGTDISDTGVSYEQFKG